jgi:putative ABC transport system permease protein
VTAAGAVSALPIGRGQVVRGIIRPGDPVPAPADMQLVLYQVATPEYRRAVGMRLVAGRDFTDADSAAAEPVTLVNETLAATLWPGQGALGREILIFTDEKTPRRVVGVFADTRQYGLDERVDLHYLVPFAQAPVRSMSVAVRAPDGLRVDDVRRAAAAVDPALPVYDVRSLDQILDGSLSSRRALAALIAVGGALAVTLAALGIYGIVASAAADRRREMGIRLALGASPGNVVRLFVRQSAWVAAAAAGAGLVASHWGARLLEDQLFGVSAGDAGSRAMAAGVLLVVAIAASWAPARRAAQADPLQTLRAE